MSDLVGVQDSRIRKLNQKPPKNDGDYVVYWMQSAVRTICNQALTYSIKSANESNCQLLVVFGLTETYPEANARHYTFMIEGLRDVSEALGKLRIPFIVLKVSKAPFEAVLDVTRCVSVREVITDFNYLRHLREWRATLAAKLDVALTQVETECVVPVELVSSKLEFAARTLRPKITGYMSDFFVLSQLPPLKTVRNERLRGILLFRSLLCLQSCPKLLMSPNHRSLCQLCLSITASENGISGLVARRRLRRNSPNSFSVFINTLICGMT